MPNWCSNTLEISHKDVKMMRRFVKGWNRGRVLDEFIPVPPELKDNCFNIEQIRKRHKQNRNKDYEKELGALTESLNQRFFGYKNWYDFCVSEWGTKWDVGGNDGTIERENDNELSMTFESAWSPPLAAYST